MLDGEIRGERDGLGKGGGFGGRGEGWEGEDRRVGVGEVLAEVKEGEKEDRESGDLDKFGSFEEPRSPD